MTKKRCAGLGSVLAMFVAHGSYAADETTAPVNVQVFKGPKVIESTVHLNYPERARDHDEEGWVQLNFMVDPSGKAYEPTIVESTGNPLFEREALRALASSRFTPAKLGDTPVTSSESVKIKFHIGTSDARRAFARAYNNLVLAIQNGDRATADAQLAGMNRRTCTRTRMNTSDATAII